MSQLIIITWIYSLGKKLESNVDLIKKFYELFKKGDRQYLQLCDDRIEWIVMQGMPNGGRHVGKKAIFDQYFPKLFSNFDEFHAITEQFLGAENLVMVMGRYQGTTKTRKKFDVPFAHVYSIENGKIVKFRQYTDTLQINNALK